MSDYKSRFGPAIDNMLEYRAALGFVASGLVKTLVSFDSYCAEHFPDCDTLTKELVFDWLTKRTGNQHNVNDATVIRRFAKYLIALGQNAYLLPDGFYPIKSGFTPYIFTDAELTALYGAIDTLPNKKNSTENVIAPVMFRLIYTCGLRPNEGRELLAKNINIDTGEIFVTNTKKKKDRIVVMSANMLALCKQYVKGERPESKYFFPRFDGQVYTSSQVDKLLKKCWANANKDMSELPTIRTYDLRHRFASARLNRWLDEGADLNNKLAYLRAYMGHKELSETAYYIHILPENLVKSAGVDWDSLNAFLPEAPCNTALDEDEKEVPKW